MTRTLSKYRRDTVIEEAITLAILPRHPKLPNGMIVWTTLPVIAQRGLPGGWATCCQVIIVRRSPQSHHGTEG